MATTPPALTLGGSTPDAHVLRFNTVRGLYYKLQSTPLLGQPFADEPGGFTQAFDASVLRHDNASGPARFYRVLSSLTP